MVPDLSQIIIRTDYVEAGFFTAILRGSVLEVVYEV